MKFNIAKPYTIMLFTTALFRTKKTKFTDLFNNKNLKGYENFSSQIYTKIY